MTQINDQGSSGGVTQDNTAAFAAIAEEFHFSKDTATPEAQKLFDALCVERISRDGLKQELFALTEQQLRIVTTLERFIGETGKTDEGGVEALQRLTEELIGKRHDFPIVTQNLTDLRERLAKVDEVATTKSLTEGVATDLYECGIVNGLILASSILHNIPEPKYFEKPVVSEEALQSGADAKPLHAQDEAVELARLFQQLEPMLSVGGINRTKPATQLSNKCKEILKG